ncbi:5582_t:CDS:2 [Funneliformis geosporum]|uniref:16512_t:CDS:1 n=1 Tax=Funneliformis geosporum TaxID=1117311 RepID=A0A9W4SYQ6_9GLOM|nr:16512_t:CDS:2 [Funneliformis geosporum]CAI2186706.1 5582_t:CDS:2 [Funneliformis geosporum]
MKASQVFEVVLNPEAVGGDDIGLGILDSYLLFAILDDIIPILATLGCYIPRNNKAF